MTDTRSAIVLTVAILGAVATISIGAYLLRLSMGNVEGVLSQLPTRAAGDSDRAREDNRRRAFEELKAVIRLRQMPGFIVLVPGLALMSWLLIWVLPSVMKG